MLIDIHTHNFVHESIIQIENLSEMNVEIGKERQYSMGLHPWFLKENTWKQEIELLTEKVQLEPIKMIGECGLDKVCKTKWSLQLDVFNAQIKLANQFKKPLIIHCVRAFEEVVQQLKTEHNEMPVVFHGFHKGQVLAERLLQQGFYLSFGAALLTNENLQNVFSKLPLHRIFFETDNSSSSLKLIFECAANLKSISLSELEIQVVNNFNKIINING